MSLTETPHVNVLQTYSYGNTTVERWKMTRKIGNYITTEFTAADAVKTLKKVCHAFDMHYELRGPEASASGNLIFLSMKNSTFTFTYHESITQTVLGFIAGTTPAPAEASIKWFYITKEGPQSAVLALTGTNPKQEFYPWMTKSLDQFADEFVQSSANVMLLIGAPGTGKTSFIRGLIRRMKYETWVTYDKEVQKNEQFYVQFASLSEEETNAGRCLVIEDADEMLEKRENGNELMNRVLNLSDGIVTLPARKIIFSTNLPGLQHVDEALIRPGRCFAAVKFRKLLRSEATKACEAVGIALANTGEVMTLSQALNNEQEMLEIQRIGF